MLTRKHKSQLYGKHEQKKETKLAYKTQNKQREVFRK
jgi:hypothetical protein